MPTNVAHAKRRSTLNPQGGLEAWVGAFPNSCNKSLTVISREILGFNRALKNCCDAAVKSAVDTSLLDTPSVNDAGC